jgi:hypothetical protein
MVDVSFSNKVRVAWESSALGAGSGVLLQRSVGNADTWVSSALPDRCGEERKKMVNSN